MIKRDVEKIDLIEADGLPHFAEAAKKHYPATDIQRYVFHPERSYSTKFTLEKRPSLQSISSKFLTTLRVRAPKSKLWKKSKK